MASKSETIELRPMELKTVDISIIGTSPLICHAWDQKVIKMMLTAQTGGVKKTKHEIKIPRNDFMSTLYWLDTDQIPFGSNDSEAEENWQKAIEQGMTHFGFPLSGIKQSIITGAMRGGLDVKMTEMRGSFFLKGGTSKATSDIAEIITPEPPKMRRDMVMVGGMSKAADIRFRAQFDTWEIPLQMTYNVNGKYSLTQLLSCFDYGGFVTGIGEWRPEKDGQFGMYVLKK